MKNKMYLELKYTSGENVRYIGTEYSQPWSRFAKRIRNIENKSIIESAESIGLAKKDLKNFENSGKLNLAIFEKVMMYYSNKYCFDFEMTI